MSIVTLAACNMRVTRDKKSNLKRILDFMDEAAAAGVDLLVCPELALQGYVDLSFPLGSAGSIAQKRYYFESAEPIPGPATHAIQSKAAQCHLTVQFGMAERAAHGSIIYNSGVIVNGDGVLGSYRKTHNRFEFPYFDPGDRLRKVRLAWGSVGSLICADIAFPELSRAYALAGVDVGLMSTAWPMKGHDLEHDDYGRALILAVCANAFFNQMWFLVSDHCEVGVYADLIDYYGNSCIVDPNGQVVASLGREEGLVVHSADIAESILESRTQRYFGLNLIQDRRPELYASLVQPKDHVVDLSPSDQAHQFGVTSEPPGHPGGC